MFKIFKRMLFPKNKVYFRTQCARVSTLMSFWQVLTEYIRIFAKRSKLSEFRENQEAHFPAIKAFKVTQKSSLVAAQLF
jgi:hypothetical protein